LEWALGPLRRAQSGAKKNWGFLGGPGPDWFFMMGVRRDVGRLNGGEGPGAFRTPQNSALDPEMLRFVWFNGGGPENHGDPATGPPQSAGALDSCPPGGGLIFFLRG